MKKSAECSDCWSPSERKAKHFFEKCKRYAFYPFVKLLIAAGVTANMVTLFSSALGVLSAAFVFIDLRFSVLLIAAAMIGDGIDGTIARATKKNSPKGSITDCFYDQVVITATTMAYAGYGIMHPAIAAYYAATYPLIIIFSILRNRLGIPNLYVFRPRMTIYGLFALYAFTGINWMDYAGLLFSIIFTGYIFHDFYVIRKKA